jgi:tetratricopeptide (TPR) repeat protein
VAVILGGLVGAALEEAAWTTESRPLTWDELSSRSRSWTERVGQWRTYWDPGDAEGWALLGDGRLARFEPDAAGACYANALRLGLDTAALRNNLGLALCLDGRLDQAESAFASALERDPDLHEARENRHSSRQTWEACEFLRQAPGAARDNRP